MQQMSARVPRSIPGLVVGQNRLNKLEQVRVPSLAEGVRIARVDEADAVIGQQYEVVATAVAGHGQPLILDPARKEVEVGQQVDVRIVGALTEQPARPDSGTVADGQEVHELTWQFTTQPRPQRSQLHGTRPADLLVRSPHGSEDERTYALQGGHEQRLEGPVLCGSGNRDGRICGGADRRRNGLRAALPHLALIRVQTRGTSLDSVEI